MGLLMNDSVRWEKLRKSLVKTEHGGIVVKRRIWPIAQCTPSFRHGDLDPALNNVAMQQVTHRIGGAEHTAPVPYDPVGWQTSVFSDASGQEYVVPGRLREDPQVRDPRRHL